MAPEELEMAGSRQKLALDMVHLEWAAVDAFDGKAEPALKPEDLAGADPARLHLRLQPYIHLLDLHYPVDDLLLEVEAITTRISRAMPSMSGTNRARARRRTVEACYDFSCRLSPRGFRLFSPA